MSRGAFDRRGADGSIAVLDGTWVFSDAEQTST